VVCPDPPYHCKAHELAGTAIDVGRELYTRRLETFWKARTEKKWPGYENAKIHLIDLPEWYYRALANGRDPEA